MNAVIIGPLALPAPALVILLAFFSALLAFQWWQKRRQHNHCEGVLWLIALSGLLGARLAFVWRYQDQYPDLLSMLDVRDGGWWWPGTLLALPLLFLALWRLPRQRGGLLIAAGAAAASAGVTLMVLVALQAPMSRLPETPLYNLQGKPVALNATTGGQPTLINLWASWCPPCRREMPVLQAAQERYSRLRIVLVNQGERAGPVRRYLTEQGLRFDFLLLDPHSTLSQYAGSTGLPLTLLVDAQGNELARHFGPLSSATLHHLVQTHLPGVSP